MHATCSRQPALQKMRLIILIFACVLARQAQTTMATSQETPTPGALKVVYAINAGGYEHTDKNGIRYEPDPLQGKIGIASDYGNHLLLIGRVPEQDEVLYRTERYHTGNFGYDVPLDGDGEYALILKFCEVYFTSPNMKVFDVVLNKHHLIVSELDIFHQVGRGTAHEEIVFFKVARGRLYWKDEESDVRSGYIRLDFMKGPRDNPKINAFALLKGDVAHVPRLSPISDDILPMDADMAVFADRVSADGNARKTAKKGEARRTVPQPPHRELPASAMEDGDGYVNDDGDGEEVVPEAKARKTSGPRQPNPYVIDDSSLMLPVFIAIAAFIPLLFCLCKL